MRYKTKCFPRIASTGLCSRTKSPLIVNYCEQVGAEQIGRAAAPNDHPLFIEALGDIVSKHLRSNESISPKFLLRCAHCASDRCTESKKWYNALCN